MSRFLWKMEKVQKNEERQGPPEKMDGSGKGQQGCNDYCDRHQVGVMLHQLRGRERREGRDKEWHMKQPGESRSHNSAALTQIYSLFLLSVAAPARCRAVQVHMLFLTTIQAWQQQTVAVGLRDKRWWNTRSCHLPSVQTRHGCKGRVCTPQKLSPSFSCVSKCLADAYHPLSR